MPQAPGDPANALCDITDLASDVLILIHRMNRAESIFNQMLGVNITALSLADIAARIGDMLDGQQSMSFAGVQPSVATGPTADWIPWTGRNDYVTPSSFAGIVAANHITFTRAGTYLCITRIRAYRPTTGGAEYLSGNLGLGISPLDNVGFGGMATSGEFSLVWDSASTTATVLRTVAATQFTAAVGQSIGAWASKIGAQTTFLNA